MQANVHLVALLLLLAVLGSPLCRAELIISSYPHYQTFDSWPECWESCTCYEQPCPNLEGGWTNLMFAFSTISGTGFDEFNWWVKSGTTPSNTLIGTGATFSCPQVVTGPCGDATSGSGNYLYAEASGCYGARFRVTTPIFYFTNTTASISYDYYMYGACIVPAKLGGLNGPDLNPATLTVWLSYNNGSTWSQLLANHSGVEKPTTPGAAWINHAIPLTLPYVPIFVQFLFQVNAAGSFSGYDAMRVFEADVAIDNVLVTELGASNITVPYIGPNSNGTGSTTSSSGTGGSGLVNGGDGISGGEIAGIVVGIIAGLCTLCCLMLLLGLALLLIFSPRKKGSKKQPEEPAETEEDEGNAGL